MIEQFWDDIVIYSVEYTVLNCNNAVELQQKILVFNSMVIGKELENIIKININGIVELLSIDEVADGLCLKKM